MNIKEFFAYRPLSVLAMAGGIRDILLGIGFLVGWQQITRTSIFQNYNELVPGVSGLVAGGFLVAVGLIVILSCIVYDRHRMNLSLKFQSLLWLFSTLMYILNGQFMLAAIFGVFFMVPAGYIGYYVKHNPAVDEVMRTQDKQDKEDQNERLDREERRLDREERRIDSEERRVDREERRVDRDSRV